MALILIQNIFEKGILEQLTQFAFDQSNAQLLQQTIRDSAIHQLGIGATREDFDCESRRLFTEILRHHFPGTTDDHIDTIVQVIEQAAARSRMPCPVT